MNAKSSSWQDLIAAWRAADWAAGVDILRPIVDELPEVLSTRLLLAGFAVQADNDGLALLHYEKMLVLAVGQGELFHALAADRGLVGLRHDDSAHHKRVQALQQWFKTMPPRARGRKSAALLQTWMVDLPAAEFRRCTEAARMVLPAPGRHALGNASEVFAVVLHGTARWSRDAAPNYENQTAAGDAIAAPDNWDPSEAVSVETQEPSALLCFEAPVAAMLRERLAAGPGAVGDADAAPAPRPSAAPRPPGLPVSRRPALDPELEPLVSKHPFPVRRSGHELVVHFENGAAELGMAGTRTGAIPGRLAELSPAGLTVTLPRPTLRQSAGTLLGAHVVTQVLLPDDDEPLRLAARVTALTFEAGSLERATNARLAVEFVLLLAPDRARLQEALIAAARDGRWPWAEQDAAPDATAAA